MTDAPDWRGRRMRQQKDGQWILGPAPDVYMRAMERGGKWQATVYLDHDTGRGSGESASAAIDSALTEIGTGYGWTLATVHGIIECRSI